MPTANELQSLSAACDRLWHLDVYRLQPGVDYQLNLQQGKCMWQQGDVAPEPLFTFVDRCVFERRTYHLFHKLLDNYERGVGIRETVTAEELSENNVFLNAVLDTAPMQYTYNWLTKNKKFVGDMSSFKKKLDSIWFGMYRRQTTNDSSGFEHVFLGEERDGKICGCHNWIQLYHEERAGRLNYLGYIRPKQRGHSFTKPHEDEQLISIQFMWEKELKPISTSLIGVSPEFEMALYTLCFMNGKEENIVQLGPYRCNIKCYPFGHGRTAKIGSAFPDTVPMTEEQAAVKIQAHVRGCITRHQVQQTHVSFRVKTTSFKQTLVPQRPAGPGPNSGSAPPAPAPQGAWGQPRKW